MKVLVVVLALARFVNAQINCFYFEDENFGYTCNLFLENSSGNEFNFVPGPHMPGKSDEDVQVLSAIAQNSPIIPKILCFQFPNLVNFTIVGSQVSFLTSSSFAYCQNVQRIELYNNLLTEIPENIFNSVENLRHLDINNNQLTTLSENSFTGTRLETLFLNLNDFETFNFAALNPINETLENLDLMTNELREIPQGAFQNFKNLKNLNLGANFFIDFPADAFIGLENLQVLFLVGNRIYDLRPSWFNTLWALEELRLEFNLVPSLPARIFANNHNLRDIGLSFNQITSINRNAFGNLTSLRSFYGEINFINAIDWVRFFILIKTCIIATLCNCKPV